MHTADPHVREASLLPVPGMFNRASRTLRFARSWKAEATPELDEIEIDRQGLRLPATFAAPACHQGDLPGWIVLGGVTRMGRFHPQLVRFVHALAASGAAVIVPEIPEWRDLRLAPGVAAPTVAASIDALDGRPEVNHGRYGLVGFSFGAPHAVVASCTPDFTERIGAVVSFGGYFDLGRTLRCQLTGLHDWEGVTHRVDPDPYGRWLLASNHLTDVPGYADAGEVSTALRALALATTEQRIPAWDVRHDGLKIALRAALSPDRRELFDLFAPAADQPLKVCDRSEAMAEHLAAACLRTDPTLDPAPGLRRLRVPVHLIHGRGDRLVPFTESQRCYAALPDQPKSHVTITGLFAHSAGHRPATVVDRMHEGWVLFRGLERAIGSVG